MNDSLNGEMVYGLTVCNPALHVRIVEPPPPTFAEVVHGLLLELVPAVLFGLAVACFSVALR